ncbi:MAG: hypothetical protein LLG20_12780, partial [Acidobacteriales bacterium]|nr:hypothetical protein [Terriglobales bacterium]
VVIERAGERAYQPSKEDLRMKYLLVLFLVLVLAVSAVAQVKPPNGPHYNLNIIAVENEKNADMQSSNRHTIFVKLSKSGTVTTNIYLVPPPTGSTEFKVCDGNGFDDAVDCQGNSKGTNGAVFQLPCNTNLSGTTGNPPVAVDIVPCSVDYPSMAYEVWARALGKPNGRATMTTCAQEKTDTDNDGTLDIICSTEHVLLIRNATKPVWKEVTDELTSLVANIDADPQLERVALFAGPFEDWFWQFENTGLRHAQLRFYALPTP